MDGRMDRCLLDKRMGDDRSDGLIVGMKEGWIMEGWMGEIMMDCEWREF